MTDNEEEQAGDNDQNASQFEDLRSIGQALQDGDRLHVEILTGGYTNFSYRVFLEGAPEIQLYAKLSFSRALWNPNAHFDLARTSNEFKMMEIFKTIDPDSVAVPYLCLDIEDMKLLVTQWSPADEQWGNQFIDGTVDVRIIPKLASALAKLHRLDFDPDFNIGVRETQLNSFPLMMKSIRDLFDHEMTQANSRVATCAKDLGQDTCEDLYTEFVKNFSKHECLTHNDSHVFNILVEKKPNINTLEQFGPEGKYVLCDWEMTIAGCQGRDLGLAYTWPVACIVAHAINGNKHSSESILDCLSLLWTEYASALKELGQKDEERLCTIYRSVIGQLGGHMFFAYFSLGIAMDALPLEGNLVSIATARESLGYLGLKCMMLGFGKNNVDLSLQSLHSMFSALMKEEINYLLPCRPSRRRMRSSMLRASGRRVSDASVFSSFTLKEQL